MSKDHGDRRYTVYETLLLHRLVEPHTSLTSPKRPYHPLSFPPEILYEILSEALLSYLEYLFASPLPSLAHTSERLAHNPIPSFLQVSHQYRETTFTLVSYVFSVQRQEDGTLPRDAWHALEFMLKGIYLAWHAKVDSACFQRHMTLRRRYKLSPILQTYLMIDLLEGIIRAFVKVPSPKQAEIDSAQITTLLGGFPELPPSLRDDMFLPSLRARRTSKIELCLSVTRLASVGHSFSKLIADVQFYESLFWDQETRTMISTVFPILTASSRSLANESLHALSSAPRALSDSEDGLSEWILTEDTLTSARVVPILWRFLDCRTFATDTSLRKMAEELLDKWLSVSMPRRSALQKSEREGRGAVTRRRSYSI